MWANGKEAEEVCQEILLHFNHLLLNQDVQIQGTYLLTSTETPFCAAPEHSPHLKKTTPKTPHPSKCTGIFLVLSSLLQPSPIAIGNV